jgi:hypothetical protein
MAGVVSHQTDTLEAWLQSQAMRCGICSGWHDIGIDSSQSTSAFPVGIISPVLHDHWVVCHLLYIISVVDSIIKYSYHALVLYPDQDADLPSD